MILELSLSLRLSFPPQPVSPPVQKAQEAGDEAGGVEDGGPQPEAEVPPEVGHQGQLGAGEHTAHHLWDVEAKAKGCDFELWAQVFLGKTFCFSADHFSSLVETSQ